MATSMPTMAVAKLFKNTTFLFLSDLGIMHLRDNGARAESKYSKLLSIFGRNPNFLASRLDRAAIMDLVEA